MRERSLPSLGVPPDRPPSGGACKDDGGLCGRPCDREGAAAQLLAATSSLLDEVSALAVKLQDELQRSVERCLKEQVRLVAALQASDISESPPGGEKPRRNFSDIGLCGESLRRNMPDGGPCDVNRRRSMTDGDLARTGRLSGREKLEPLHGLTHALNLEQDEQVFYRKVHDEIAKAEQGRAKKRVTDCVFKEERRKVEATMTWLQRVTMSRTFEWASGFFIVLNAVLLGLETHWEAESAWGSKLSGTPMTEASAQLMGLDIITALFCLLFAAELGVRWAADGLVGFFRTTDVGWNVFDILIVSVGVVDQFFSLFTVRLSTNVSVLRVLRVVRIVRCARIIRVLRFFRELRIMVYSILGSFKSLLWVMMILVLIFYVSGIFLTMGIATLLKENSLAPGSDVVNLHAYFGTLGRSMISLYMAMSGGNDWSVFYDALEGLPLYQTFFLFFITFAVFAVVNIVTGVFVDAALQSNSDKEVIVNEEMEGKKEYLVEMGKLFAEMDTDRTGSITQEEFQTSLADERVVAYFRALSLDVTNPSALFRLLDRNCSGTIERSEFLIGCYQLQGQATAINVADSAVEFRSIKEAVLKLTRDMSGLVARMESAAPARRGAEALTLSCADTSCPTTTPTAEAPTPAATSAGASSGCTQEGAPQVPLPPFELLNVSGSTADPVPVGLLPLQVPCMQDALAFKAPPRPRQRMRHAALSPLRAVCKTADARGDADVVDGRLLPDHPGGA